MAAVVVAVDIEVGVMEMVLLTDTQVKIYVFETKMKIYLK